MPAYLRKMIRSGACRLNGEASTPDTLLSASDCVTIKESSSVKGFLEGAPAPIDILWQDDCLLALNKPPGLAMHPAAEVGENLADLASTWLEKRAGLPVRAYPVNRLDRGTSGVVLLATSSGNAGMLGRQVKEQGLEKRYLAVVEGLLTGEGKIDNPLDGKESVTCFSSLAVGTGHSFLMVEPVTGRTHQIRRHLSMIGHPVAGDKRYDAAVLPALPGIALHSFRTTLHHPSADSLLTICAPLPAELSGLIAGLCVNGDAALLKLILALSARVVP